MVSDKNHEPVATSIPECKPPRHFDALTLTSELTAGLSENVLGKLSNLECERGVQTVFHPPFVLKPVVRPPSNRFRQEVLRKYPFMVNRDSLYDKEEKILRDPNDVMLSTYKRDYGCILGDIELVRSSMNEYSEPEPEPVRYPSEAYKIRNRSRFSAEMKQFYALPGGGWALNSKFKQPPPKELPQPVSPYIAKWESEYQANINGIAEYMKKVGALTKRVCRIHRQPTLPKD